MSDCWDCCADLEPLHSAWLDGALSPSQHSRVTRHLRDCSGCRGELDSLQAVRGLLRSMPVRRLPEGVRGRVQAQGQPAAAGPRLPEAELQASPWRRLARRTVAGAAMVLGLLGGAAFALGGQPEVAGPTGPELRTVRVPVDLYVADHLVRAITGPLSTPMVLEARQ